MSARTIRFSSPRPNGAGPVKKGYVTEGDFPIRNGRKTLHIVELNFKWTCLGHQNSRRDFISKTAASNKSLPQQLRVPCNNSSWWSLGPLSKDYRQPILWPLFQFCQTPVQRLQFKPEHLNINRLDISRLEELTGWNVLMISLLVGIRDSTIV